MKWQKGFPKRGGDPPPDELVEWLDPKQSKRSASAFSSMVLSISQGGVEAFGDAWWNWWRGLQPDERDTEEGILACDGPYTWTRLCKSGKNGMFLIMVALASWGQAIRDVCNEESDEFESWTAALKEVIYALKEMIVFVEKGASKPK